MTKTLIIILAVGFLVSCSSCTKSVKKEVNENNKKVILKKPVEPGLSPGTALVKATLLEGKTSKTSNTIFLTINKIIDYGHSTPQLAKGEKIYVFANDKNLLDQLIKDKSDKILLKHSPPKVGEETSVEWTLIMIER